MPPRVMELVEAVFEMFKFGEPPQATETEAELLVCAFNPVAVTDAVLCRISVAEQVFETSPTVA